MELVPKKLDQLSEIFPTKRAYTQAMPAVLFIIHGVTWCFTGCSSLESPFKSQAASSGFSLFPLVLPNNSVSGAHSAKMRIFSGVPRISLGGGLSFSALLNSFALCGLEVGWDKGWNCGRLCSIFALIVCFLVPKPFMVHIPRSVCVPAVVCEFFNSILV